MSRLSISVAWEETKAILTRDGKLFASVALALVALPTAVTGLVNPTGVADSDAALWIDLVVIIASLVALSGQLALIRLALGPSITVGGAIAHGIRRMPVYFLAAVIIIAGLLVAAIPFAVVLAAMGVTINPDTGRVPSSPGLYLVATVYFALACFVGVRMVLGSTAASAEPIGPIAIIKRSWQLTSDHWWMLFGFLVAFFVGAGVLLLALETVLTTVVTLGFGAVTAMSASALVIALVQALANALVTTVFAVMLARIYAQAAGRDIQASVPTSGT
jgi:hypothetical protein